MTMNTRRLQQPDAANRREFTALVALVLLAGCASSALRTTTPVNIESKHRVSDTAQTCDPGAVEEVRAALETAWPIVLEELQRHVGIDPGVVAAKAGGTWRTAAVRVCRLREPDVCIGGKAGCVEHPLCARKAGCADLWSRFAWISEHWPPVCRGSWPMEPHCVLPGAERKANWRATLVAELASLGWMASGGKTNYHQEPRVLAAITAAIARLGWG